MSKLSPVKSFSPKKILVTAVAALALAGTAATPAQAAPLHASAHLSSFVTTWFSASATSRILWLF